MGFLSRLRLGARLGLAFGITGVLVCLTGVFGLSQMAKVNSNTEDLATNWLPSVQALGDISDTLNDIRRTTLRHVLEPTATGKQQQEALILSALNTALPKELGYYETQISSPEERALFTQMQAALNTFKEDEAKLLALSNQGETGLAAARDFAVGQAGLDFRAMMALTKKDIALNVQGGADSWAQAQKVYSNAVTILVVSIVVLLGICAALAWRITVSITTPLAQAVKLTHAVAAGDLSQRAQSDALDEVGDLMRALNDMGRNLSQLVGEVRQGTDSMATASAQIAQGNADLSSRTEQQAASLQQTAASLHQMTDTVNSNSDNARQANQLVAQATMVATQGGEDVNSVVATMSAIQDSSRRIADIISVIDGIAFQTNILALNAAVEAARAGEQGRGFAVVASEVRSLAQRSANAAKEIKSLITDSVEKVEIGNAQVNNAGRTIQEVVIQVRKVNDLIAEITASSSEQSTGVGQINQAVNQLDQATQQNAALVEETSAAAESLRQQASMLSQSVSVFRV
jgi:methyl-accepting chemotaxis protein